MNHLFIENIKNENMTTETVAQIRSAEERMLAKAYEEYYSKVAAIMKCEPEINVTIDKVPVSKVAYITEVNKSLELDTIDRKQGSYSYVEIKQVTGMIQVSSYDRDLYMSF